MLLYAWKVLHFRNEHQEGPQASHNGTVRHCTPSQLHSSCSQLPWCLLRFYIPRESPILVPHIERSTLMTALQGSWTRESGVLNTMIGILAFIWLSLMYPLIVIAVFKRVPEEEAALHKAFGKEWEQRRKDVPYSLIPFIY